ncbi:MAG: hypothetical protein GY845_01685 [Planctomycetes bacterium]|nr:hypothetical protein [Planctomycetota bacterium]
MTKKTKTNFEIFSETSSKLIEILGLHCYQVQFAEGGDFIDEDTCNATCATDLDNGSAILSITSIAEGIDADEAKHLALHEVLELLVSELNTLAEERAQDSELGKARHRLIRRLEHVLEPIL